MSVNVRQDTVLNLRNTTTEQRAEDFPPRCLQSQDSAQTSSTTSHHYEDIEHGSTNPRINPSPRPPLPSRTSSSSGPSSSEGSESSGQMLLTKSGPDSETECEKLEKSTQRIKTVVIVLLVVCTIVVIVYLIVIVSLITQLSKKTDPVSAARPQPPTHGPRVNELGGGNFDSLLDRENCVHEDRVEEFKRIWDPEDKQDIMDLLKGSGFMYHSLSSVYCFTSLQWVPEIMGKINSRVQDSVSYIENQQEKINHTVSLYISSNKEETNCSTESKEPIDPTDPLHSVYAHFFMDTDINYTQPEENVRWILEGQSQSTKQGVDILSKGGQFIIRQSGFYFVYTHLVFMEGDSRDRLHRVVNNRDGQRTKLLETFQGSASLLQGVFRLRTNDRLSVEASTETLDTTREKMSYFGVYLIRT